MGTGLRTAFLVAVGAALGANARYWLVVWSARQFGVAFPFGTLLVNLIGSFCIGVLFAVLEGISLPLSDDIRLVLVVGVLGGFTTFSSFSYETLQLMRTGQLVPSIVYTVLSVVVGVGMCAVGFWAALALRR